MNKEGCLVCIFVCSLYLVFFKNMTEVEGMTDKHSENEEQPFK